MILGSKVGYQLQIKHSRRQIIGNGIFFSVDVGDPLIGDSITDLEQVENLKRDPDIVKYPERIFIRKFGLRSD